MCEITSRPDVPSIENSIESISPETYKTVTERYYTKYYCLDEDREKCHDILVLNHSNKICLITLSPTHPVISKKLEVKKVNFEISAKIDRKSNKTTGKSKKGGQALETTSILAIVETETESFPIKAVVPGKLICINEELINNPGKLVSHTDSEGHIAIILPAKGQYDQIKSTLTTNEEFEKL